MTDERYLELETDMNSRLTEEEIKEGWHWCYDFDLLLVGPGMGEQEFCQCFRKDLK